MSLRLGCFNRARSGAARGAAGKGQQSDVAGALNGNAQPTLVTCADSRHAARKNLAAFLHELRKNVGALVVDEVHLLDTEFADFLFAEKLALAAARSAGTAARTTGTAFAASATAATWTTFATATAATVAAWSAMSAMSSASWSAFTTR
jgi:hypothetical protein